MVKSAESPLDAWVTEMTALGRAARTIEDRVAIVRRFHRSTGLDDPTRDACRQDVIDWLVTTPSAASTRGTYRRALHAYYGWAVLTKRRPAGPLPTDDIPMATIPRRRPRPMPTETLAGLLATCRGYPAAYVRLAAFAGLRAHEIAAMRGENVDLVHREITVVGKGGVEARLPAHQEILRLAELYPRAGWWFPSPAHPGEHVDRVSVSIAVTRNVERIGGEGTCHQLRHWFGTKTLRASGGNLRVAQENLRHASPVTTAIYTEVDDGERRSAIDGLVA